MFLVVFFQIGRRIFRQRLETGDREADVEQRRVWNPNSCGFFANTLLASNLDTFSRVLWNFIIFGSSSVQAFQKLIYVSTLVFGEASSFLLPWKRIFKVTDAQVYVISLGNVCLCNYFGVAWLVRSPILGLWITRSPPVILAYPNSTFIIILMTWWSTNISVIFSFFIESVMYPCACRLRLPFAIMHRGCMCPS